MVFLVVCDIFEVYVCEFYVKLVVDFFEVVDCVFEGEGGFFVFFFLGVGVVECLVGGFE